MRCFLCGKEIGDMDVCPYCGANQRDLRWFVNG